MSGSRSGRGAIPERGAPKVRQDGQTQFLAGAAGSAGESGKKMRATTRTRTTRGAGRRARPVKASSKKRTGGESSCQSLLWQARPAVKVVVPLEPVAVQAVQGRLGGDCGSDTPNAQGHAFLFARSVPKSHRVPGPGARLSRRCGTPSGGRFAPRGRNKEAIGTLNEKRAFCGWPLARTKVEALKHAPTKRKW